MNAIRATCLLSTVVRLGEPESSVGGGEDVGGLVAVLSTVDDHKQLLLLLEQMINSEGLVGIPLPSNQVEDLAVLVLAEIKLVTGVEDILDEDVLIFVSHLSSLSLGVNLVLRSR